MDVVGINQVNVGTQDLNDVLRPGLAGKLIKDLFESVVQMPDEELLQADCDSRLRNNDVNMSRNPLGVENPPWRSSP